MSEMELNRAGVTVAMEPARAKTFVDILRWRALHQPDRCAYIFLTDGEQEERMTYAQLDEHARSIAATLQQHISPGERALLLFPSGLEYIAAFMGCLYAGIIAVPAYPPSSNRSMPRIQTIAVDASIKLALTHSSLLPKLRNWSRPLPAFSELRWVATDAQEEVSSAKQWQPYTPAPEGLAFLQYTSGSTGIPKGVMVSHGNLIHNSEMLRDHCGHTGESICVSWLPMFHDLGLIFGVLQPAYVGFTGVLMAPAAFIQRPLRWLQAISHYRGTTTAAPNFAYELCTNRITPEERAQLHLESWRLAGNAAEPVRAETVERFTSTFASCGLPKTAMTPAYGLAETTLMVSCATVEAETNVIYLDRTELEQKRFLVTEPDEAKDSLAIVGCGSIARDQRVLIVNPETLQVCEPNEIGEIWVEGPSMAQGYWERPQETEAIFHAYLSDTHEGPFVRTGDLGFVYNEEVYIAGRIKDLIIIRGRNYYPQDIELTVERSHPSLRPGCGAAFSVEVDNEERLVVVQEVVRHPEEPEGIIKAIRQAISEQYEIKAHAVVLIRYGSIFKTSSGKIQRRFCRDAFLKNELIVVAADIQQEATPSQGQVTPEQQQVLLAQLAEATPSQRREMLLAVVTEQAHTVLSSVPKSEITPECNLLSLGMDSLSGTQLLNRLETRLGRTFANLLPLLVSEPTPNRLVEYLTTALFPSNEAGTLNKRLTSSVFALEEVEALSEDETEAWLEAQLGSLEVNGMAQIKQEPVRAEAPLARPKQMQFSLLYFSSNEAEFTENKYELLLKGATFADQHDFSAVWLPERHFHPFGGLYPNPSVLASALAMVTQKIRLRAGSVVLPMHHPVRVAEEWSVVDNLSSGRVDLAFATGWNPNDFVLAPDKYELRKDVLFSSIETFQELWSGKAVPLPNGLGKEALIKIYPQPKQSRLTPWITCTGTPERFVQAGAMGANVLTGLLFQSAEELGEKIKAYRDARAQHGYDPATGHVTLMLHTFVGEDMDEVREKVRGPFIEYLRSSVDLWRNRSERLDALSPEEQEQVLAYAFERYFQTHGLFGTPQTCKKLVDSLGEIGVDEIACLIDFGIDVETVMDGLYSLSVLQKRCQKSRHMK